MAEPTSAAIEDYLVEERTFPPPPEFVANALVTGTAIYDEANDDFEAFWARQAARSGELVEGLAHDLRVGAALRQVVRGRRAQRLLQLPRPPRRGRPGRQGGLPLGGRAGRHPHHHLRRAARRGAALRQRPQGPRRGQGRPGQHLPADDPRAARSPCWPAPASGRRTRWCSAASRPTPSPTASTTPRPRCSSPPTAAGGAARRCRSRPTPTSPWPTSPTIEHVVVVQRTGTDVHMEAGRDLWYHDIVAGRRSGLPARADRQRAPALPALHLGHHGQAQGHHAHHRAATSPRWPSPTSTSSTSTPTPTSTGARPTSAGSPATATSSTARWPTGPPA